MLPVLRDIDKFIENKNIKQVSSIRIYSVGNKLEKTGLFSEEIFGRLGSFERRKTFGFINLKCSIIHPEAWSLVLGMSPEINKMIKGVHKYIVDKDGALTINEDVGETGLFSFIKLLPTIDLDTFKTKDPKKAKTVNYVKKNINRMIITKFLVLPAGIRDITVSKASGKTNIQYNEVVNLYENIIRQTNMISGDINMLPSDLAEPIVNSIQRNVLAVNEWVRKQIKGKHGIIRGGMFKKVTDYSGRLVIISDPTLKLGYVGLPWQFVLRLYEPFAIHQILYKSPSLIPIIKYELNIDTEPDISDVKRLFKNIIENPLDVSAQLKEELVEIAKQITKDKVCIYKRDPVENRDSWLSAYIRVDAEGYVANLNALDLPRSGGDCDGRRELPSLNPLNSGKL